MNTPKNMPETRRLLRIREVLQLCALSRATLYSKIKQHTFPAPVKLSARAVGWLHDDVMQWIDARIAQRGPAYQANDQTSSSAPSVGTKIKHGRSQAKTIRNDVNVKSGQSTVNKTDQRFQTSLRAVSQIIATLFGANASLDRQVTTKAAALRGFRFPLSAKRE